MTFATAHRPSVHYPRHQAWYHKRVLKRTLVSLPTVVVGVARHARLKAFDERLDLTQTVAPMGVGSVVGAVAGGLLVGLVPAAALKLVLGVILIVSGVCIFQE
jgi:uncharacterized membrane protein YfcA